MRFVRQLSHDLRNHLNAIELQSTFLAELAQDGELKPEVQRLREMTYEIGVTLQKLTGAMSEANPRLMSYRAADFVDDLREKLEADRPKESGSIEWDVKLGDETLQIDPQLMQQAGLELFNNAFQHERGEGNLVVQCASRRRPFRFRIARAEEDFCRPNGKLGDTSRY